MLKTLARPYAKALFELALEAKTVDDWRDRLRYLSQVLQTTELGARCSDRRIAPAAWVDFLISLDPSLLDHEQLRRLLQILAEKRRLGLLPLIQARYEALVREHEGEKAFVLRVASPMDKSTEQDWQTFLVNTLQSAVSIETVMDERLVGGVDLSGEGLRLDQSLPGILAQLRRSLRSA